MAIKQIGITNIIAYLNTVISLGNRIYFGQPIDIPSGDYITINILSETNRNNNKGTLLEFSFIGVSEWVTFSSLLNYRKTISNSLTGNKSLSGFYVYWCNEDGGLINWYEEKNRKIVKQNYRFYFTN